MILRPGHFILLAALTLCAAHPARAGDAEEFCDPVTNVCFCTGGWEGEDCVRMKPFCEPGAWHVCTDSVCSCTRQTWAYGEHRGAPSTDRALPETPPDE